LHGLAVPPNLSEGKRLWPLVIVPLMAFLLPATQDMVERVMQRPRPWLGVVGGLGLLAILILLGEGNVRGFAYYQF
jgi:alginate O-acetyltransferase complex protein AlgI